VVVVDDAVDLVAQRHEVGFDFLAHGFHVFGAADAQALEVDEQRARGGVVGEAVGQRQHQAGARASPAPRA
jgi:hypothetical protein